MLKRNKKLNNTELILKCLANTLVKWLSCIDFFSDIFKKSIAL